MFIVSGRCAQWPDHSQVETQILVHQQQVSPPSTHIATILVEALGFSLLVYCHRASSFLYPYLSKIKLTVLPLLKSLQRLPAACPLVPSLGLHCDLYNLTKLSCSNSNTTQVLQTQEMPLSPSYLLSSLKLSSGYNIFPACLSMVNSDLQIQLKHHLSQRVFPSPPDGGCVFP